MAQVKRRLRYRSPPPRKLPVLPNPIHFHPPTPKKGRRASQTVATPSQSNISHNKQSVHPNGPLVSTNNFEESLFSINFPPHQFPNFEKQAPLSETNLSLQNNHVVTRRINWEIRDLFSFFSNLDRIYQYFNNE